MKKLGFGFLLVVFFSSCGGSWIPTEVDATMGNQSKTFIDENPDQFKIIAPEEAPYAYKRLEAIRDAILASGAVKHKDDFAWELKIVHEDSVLNAFCLPGGYIYVYTGLIKYLESEAALAGVIGHEIAHADERHSVQQTIKNMGIGLLLQYVLGVDNSGLLNMGANLLSLSFSRSDESEADALSVKYLYPTPYDARGAAHFFEQLEKDKQTEQMLEFISTHPNPENRVQEIEKVWEELGGKKGELFKEEYQKTLKDLP
ncbi:MAG: M48 family metallopeptidase [Bacteroidota bacterium]|nr:M48 family metallopeptidase [Bacteroidota bacterium]